MKAVEINAKTDKNGFLKIDYPLKKKTSNVRVIILFDEKNNETDEEQSWLQAISSNPAFGFLHDPAEDVYSIVKGRKLDG